MDGRALARGVGDHAHARRLYVDLCRVSRVARLTPFAHVMPPAQLFGKRGPSTFQTGASYEMPKTFFVHIHGLRALCTRFGTREYFFAIMVATHLAAIRGARTSVDKAVHVGGSVVMLAQRERKDRVDTRFPRTVVAVRARLFPMVVTQAASMYRFRTLGAHNKI